MIQTRIVRDRAGLRALRSLKGLDAVTVEAARFSHRNLLPCAIKYAFWSVRPGGSITIVGTRNSNAAAPAYSVSFNLIRQWIFKFIGAECRLRSSTDDTIVLERVSQIVEPGWSAGVVFSGSDGEIPTLMRCLDGLKRQPELSEAQGGEIFICGPARDTAFLDGYPGVRYLEYEPPSGQRFLIGRKKNAMMSAMRNPRMVVLHARIVLDDNALASVPREFDITGPATRARTRLGTQPYLSLQQTDIVWPGWMPRRSTAGIRDIPSGEPLALMERGAVFIDGGAFYVMRAVFDACPLHPEIAWEESEDVEWCGRALALGFLTEMTPESGALSQTRKLKDWSKLGPVERPVRLLTTELGVAKAAIANLAAKARGKR